MTALLSLLLLFDMTDPEARMRAEQLWGSQAWVAYGRGMVQGNWDRYVGFVTPHCKAPFWLAGLWVQYLGVCI